MTDKEIKELYDRNFKSDDTFDPVVFGRILAVVVYEKCKEIALEATVLSPDAETVEWRRTWRDARLSVAKGIEQEVYEVRSAALRLRPNNQVHRASIEDAKSGGT